MRYGRLCAGAAIILSVCGWLGVNALRGQTPDMGDPQLRAQNPGQEPPPEGPALPNAERKALEGNDKDMKKKVNRLYELATELKAEVDKTDSSRVLSLNLVKKAEEIERLARDIKNKGKG